MTNQEYEKKLQELQTEIDELKANKPTEYKRWRACDDQLYFKIDNLGDVEEIVEIGYSSDDYRYNTGNYFKTEKEAEQHKAYLLALQTIKDDVEGFAPDWENSHEKKWFGYYDHEQKKIYTSAMSLCQTQGVIYFKTHDKLQHSQKVHEAEWLTVLGVE